MRIKPRTSPVGQKFFATSYFSGFTHRMVVHASSVNDFKNKLDAHWSNQEMVYNYQIEISGTGSRSNFQ